MGFYEYFLKILMSDMTNSHAVDALSGILESTELFKSQAISGSLKISVILPVRNEQDNLIRTLDALRNQVDGYGQAILPTDYEVLLLANNCTDCSVEIAHSYQCKYPHFNLHIEEIRLPKPIAHIGTVRRLLMDAAFDRLTLIGNSNGVIASTDSDSEVDQAWVYHTLREISDGNDVVGGRIFTKAVKDMARLYYLRDITYKHLVAKLEDLIDPVKNDRWPRHFQCFGASFAVTCQIYDRCGRLPVVPFLEDMAFHKSLIRIDARIRLSPYVQVFTSSRIQGRVDFGLSIQLKQWGEMNAQSHPLMVESVGSLIAKLNARKLLRDAWATNQSMEVSEAPLTQAAILLNINQNWLAFQMQESTYFGMFWEMIQDKLQQEGWAQAWPPMNIIDAIAQLKKNVSKLMSE